MQMPVNAGHERKNELEVIDLRMYWQAIMRRKWSILLLTFVVTSISVLVVYSIKPVYKATATVMIESEQAKVVSIEDVYGMDTRRQEYFLTQFEILKSRPLAEKVIDRLGLENTEDFVTDEPGEADSASFFAVLREWKDMLLPPPPVMAAGDEDALRKITASTTYSTLLEISPIRNTQLAKVSFSSYDPARAAQVANEHAQAFIESHIEAKGAVAGQASTWMASRLEELRGRLNAAEARLQAFKEQERLVDVEGIQALPAQQLNELTSKLVEARRDLSQIRSAYSQVQQVRGGGLDARLAIPAVKADPLVQQFRQARATADLKIAELSKRYGPQHPKMKAAMSERDSAERALSHQVESVINAISNEYQMRESNERAIVSAMDTAKADVQVVGRKESEYRSLLREVETSRQLYDLFYTRISETKETSDLVTPNARIIEPAIVPPLPDKPRKSLIVGLTFVLSLMLGVFMTLLLDMLDNTLRHASDVEQKLRKPLLGMVPLLRHKFKKDVPIHKEFLNRDEQGFGEAIRSVRTAITLNGLEHDHRVVMITSSLSGEGKTSLSTNLALAFAQMERVLLIDADMRRPTIAELFGLSRRQPGLSDLCAHAASEQESIVHVEEGNLDILTSGMIPPNPQELLGSQRMRQVLDGLREHYDRIIIDCPPVLPVSDALLLANLADVAVYVVRADSTSVKQVNSGLQLLALSRIDLAGLVLSQVDTGKLANYGEYSGGYYYGGYAAREAT